MDKEVRRILNSETKLKGMGIEKTVKPSNIIDIYTRLEILLGLKLSGHTDTVTEASSLKDDFYKEVKYKRNNNIEKLLISFLPKKWYYLVNYWKK